MQPGPQAELHHFIGKDIVNFHGLFWPAVLTGAGFRRPTELHVNGYLTVNGAKMSKSRGTFIQARTYLDAGLDPEYLRYYFAAKSSGGVDDLDLNLQDFAQRVNSDLVGKFVNIASRCTGFLSKRFDGKLIGAPSAEAEDFYRGAAQRLEAACLGANGAYRQGDFIRVLRAVMAEADATNELIAARAPWQLAKQEGKDAELHDICSLALNMFRLLAGYLAPILPATAKRAAALLNTSLDRFDTLSEPLRDHAIEPYSALITRIDPKQIAAMVEASKESMQGSEEKQASIQAETKKTKAQPAVANHQSQITNHKQSNPESRIPHPGPTMTTPESQPSNPGIIGIDDFAKLDLRIGKVLECEFVEGSDKLLRFKLDAGDLGQRQIFSGIRASYAEPEKLVGRNVVFISNLAPRKMRFGLSEGMILSAGFDGGALALLDADQGAAPGMPVR